MAFVNSIVFEVDAATGSDSNGGGFDDTSGTPGTNYAWGAGQTTIAYSDLTTTGVSAALHSVGRAFISADVGNVINITGGTNFTTGRYQILSVAAGVATVDRNCATGVGASGTGTLGGSLLTIQKGIDCAFINAGAVESCAVFIKKGNYTGTVALTTASSVSPSNYNFRIYGYKTTHGDNPMPQSGDQPVYAVGSGAGVDGIDITTSGFLLGFITFDGAVTSGTQGVKGVNWTTSYGRVTGCKVKNFSSDGLDLSSGINVSASHIESVSNGGNGISVNVNGVSFCWCHKNTGDGIKNTAGGAGSSILHNLCTNNTGNGISPNSFDFRIIGNTCYGNGGNGINYGGTTYLGTLSTLLYNNILAKNGGYGIAFPNLAPSNQSTLSWVDYNAYYGNTSGTISQLSLNTHDVSIAANPFNSSDADLAAETTPNWGLNSTSSAGASLRAVGFPGNIAGLSTTTGYPDIGAVQHQDSGGGGGGATYTGFMIQ